VAGWTRSAEVRKEAKLVPGTWGEFKGSMRAQRRWMCGDASVEGIWLPQAMPVGGMVPIGGKGVTAAMSV